MKSKYPKLDIIWVDSMETIKSLRREHDEDWYGCYTTTDIYYMLEMVYNESDGTVCGPCHYAYYDEKLYEIDWEE